MTDTKKTALVGPASGKADWLQKGAESRKTEIEAEQAKQEKARWEQERRDAAVFDGYSEKFAAYGHGYDRGIDRQIYRGGFDMGRGDRTILQVSIPIDIEELRKYAALCSKSTKPLIGEVQAAKAGPKKGRRTCAH